MSLGMAAASVPGLDHATATGKVNDGWILNGFQFRCREVFRSQADPWQQAKQMGTGIPAIADGYPIVLEDVIEYILIPLAQPSGIGPGELTTTSQKVSLTPSF